MYDDDVVTMDAAAGSDDPFATSELPVPPAQPDAHRGRITGVTLETFESGSSAVKVSLQSTDVPTLETNMMVFLPRAFVEDIAVDATHLPEEEGNKQQTSFRIGVANSDGTATLQELRKLCKDEQGNWLPGRTPTELGLTKATDIASFVENHNKMLSGLDVIFYRKPDAGEGVDPRFKNQLRVRGIVAVSNADNPKFLKKGNYLKLWEQN